MALIGWIIQIVFGLLGLKKPAGPTVEAQAEGRAEAAQASAAVAVASAKTQTAIAQAEADAPKAPAAVIDQLNKGDF